MFKQKLPPNGKIIENAEFPWGAVSNRQLGDQKLEVLRARAATGRSATIPLPLPPRLPLLLGSVAVRPSWLRHEAWSNPDLPASSRGLTAGRPAVCQLLHSVHNLSPARPPLGTRVTRQLTTTDNCNVSQIYRSVRASYD